MLVMCLMPAFICSASAQSQGMHVHLHQPRQVPEGLGFRPQRLQL